MPRREVFIRESFRLLMSTMTRRTRRSFGTIHAGHLGEEYSSLIKREGGEEAIQAYYERLRALPWTDMGYTAGAFALERGERSGRVHVQFYVEHSQKRASTLAKQFMLQVEQVFYDTVRHAAGSWAYCTGQGKYAEKEALDRFRFGDPVLFGGSEADSSLRWCVDQLLSGSTPEDLLRDNAYAYCVHRQRIWALHTDLNHIERHGRLAPPLGQ